jgi:DNA-directed RNA polymerase specialized sigma24 family protein
MAALFCFAPDRSLNADLLRLHALVVEGDYRAFEALVEWLFHPLLQEVIHLFPRIDEQIICDRVVDAVLAYGRAPEHYDPTLGVSLAHFLRLLARRKVLNRQRSELRERRRQQQVRKQLTFFVEVAPPAGNIKVERIDNILAIQQQLLAACKDPIDRALTELLLAGVPGVRPYAEVLGITEYPSAAQRQVVKKAKDRLQKQLQRFGRQLLEESHRPEGLRGP